MQTWYQTWCPKCKAQNWVCDGDTSDETVPDLGAIECRECQFLYMGWQDQLTLHESEISDLICGHSEALTEEENVVFYDQGKTPETYKTIEKQQWFFREFLGVEKAVMMVEEKK